MTSLSKLYAAIGDADDFEDSMIAYNIFCEALKAEIATVFNTDASGIISKKGQLDSFGGILLGGISTTWDVEYGTRNSCYIAVVLPYAGDVEIRTWDIDTCVTTICEMIKNKLLSEYTKKVNSIKDNMTDLRYYRERVAMHKNDPSSRTFSIAWGDAEFAFKEFKSLSHQLLTIKKMMKHLKMDIPPFPQEPLSFYEV